MTTMGRHGDGGITKRADGRLQVTITLPTGQRLFRYVPRMADATAQRRLAVKALRELRDARSLDLEPERQTLEVYLRSWLRSLGEGRRIRPRTIEFYSMIVEQRILPVLGATRLDRLTPGAVQGWLDRQAGSPRTIHHCRAVLRRALNVAVRQRILARNPATEVELPDAPEFAGDPLTAPEARALVSSTAAARLGALWRLALITGLRQGELLGLAWDDIDLDAGRVTVSAQLARRAGAWVRVEPKSARRLQRVAIDPATVAALRSHQLRQAAERTAEWRYWGLVFVSSRGNPIAGADCLRLFHGACDAAGIRRRRFHDLRVSSATLLAELGVDEHVRMARLGHATTAMARHYAIARDELDRDASTRLAEALA